MAGLQLIAGDVRRVQPIQLRVEMLARPAARAVPDAPAFQEESFFEYHLYTLDGATTVRNNEQKQMTLLSAHGAAMQKRLIYDGRQGFWGIRNPGYFPGEGYDTSANMKVRVVVEAKNSRPGLGIPLPKGTVRLFKADSRGNLQFIGEDEIDHTPKDELIRLHVGDSFDVVGEHKRTDFKRIGPKEVEETFEVLVRNRREQAEEVSVVEHLWQDWRVTAKSAEFVKKDAHTIEFRVKLQPGAEGKVTYTVRTRWN
jgi:hypothetical protein